MRPSDLPDMDSALPPPLVETAPGHAVACHFAGRAAELREQAGDPAIWNRAA